MELGRNVDHIVAGTALFGAAATAYYTHVVAKNLNEDVADLQAAMDEIEKKYAQVTSSMAALERSVNVQQEQMKLLKNSQHMVMQQSGETAADTTDIREGLVEWATDVVDAIREINTSSTIDQPVIGEDTHRSGRATNGGRGDRIGGARRPTGRTRAVARTRPYDPPASSTSGVSTMPHNKDADDLAKFHQQHL
jgi:hypothetical protein